MAAALFLAACSTEDEVDAETAVILKQVPTGTPFRDLSGAMQRLGFSCVPGQLKFVDQKGNWHDAEAHLSCEREERYPLACARRTRVLMLQLNGRLSNVLVNVGRFC
ncbi:MAG: hypothetical protein ACREUS_03660 [Burkholderiales bacterium]